MIVMRRCAFIYPSDRKGCPACRFGLIALLIIAASTDAVGQGPTTSFAPKALPLKEEQELLSRLKAAEFEKLKAEALAPTLDRNTRAVAMYEIAALGTKSAAEFFESVFDHPLNFMDNEKLMLVDASGEHGGSDSIPLLLKGLRYRPPGVPPWDETGDVRWHAARALLRIQGEEALPIVEPLLLDPKESVRTAVSGYIKDLKSQLSEVESRSLFNSVIAWAKSPVAGPYIKEDVVYLLKRGDRPRTMQDETTRLYSDVELELLGRFWDSYYIFMRNLSLTEVSGIVASTRALALEGPIFPVSGWRLRLTKIESGWSVTEAIPNK
jgi:hypothetical protein